MKILSLITGLCLWLPLQVLGQQSKTEGILSGQVYETKESGEDIPLIGANVYWLDQSGGVVTDGTGFFSIPRVKGQDTLVVSYVGYQSDTLVVGAGEEKISVYLRSSVRLEEVNVVHRQKTTSTSYIDPMRVQKIGEEELFKAACCNLSESFETTPSIDVNFTDAVTGTRQIQMLGLAGPYTQIMRENMPDVRGLSSMHGLIMTPGAWVESMQLSKGTGSVLNGYESIAGQINVELRKAPKSDRLYINGYGNQAARFELNVNGAQMLNDNLSSVMLLHGNYNNTRHDKNQDGFIDEPLSRHFIAMNRWQWRDKNGFEAQVGIKGSWLDNTGGQMEFDPGDTEGNGTFWGLQQDIKRLELWTKIGKVFPDIPWRSIGFQLGLSGHTQDGHYGPRDYDARQNTLYANLIYQSILMNTFHNFKAGISLMYDDVNEQLESRNYDRVESVPGGFFEYSYLPDQSFSLVIGLRGDYHSDYEIFATPRVHLRYAPNETTVIRASAGRGQRTASVIAENQGLLASSREFEFVDIEGEGAFGLDAEIAWNFGINLAQDFRLALRNGTVAVDLYRTHFINQVVLDLDADPQKVLIYNLEGQSFSNNVQVQVDYELVRNLDLRIAYRFSDVRTDYTDGLLRKPLVARHRAFANIAYSTQNGWAFDFTANWQGEKRLPSTVENPVPFRRQEYSPDFVLFNTQITKSWDEKFDLYVGAENLFDFTQNDPIIAPDDPFSEYFDASMVWAPVFGRNIYAGFRYRLK